jgi:Fe-S-cluster containining protein
MERYRGLTAKIDGFFARVQARHPGDLQCGTGCADCCHTRLSVTSVEAAAIAELVAGLTGDERAALAELAARPLEPTDVRCAALGDDDRCRIYAARPVVCRSHGAPIRLGRAITACHRNFTARGPAAADPDCVLDQTTLSMLVLAVDQDHRRAHGDPGGSGGPGDGRREDLAALLVRLLA